MEKASLKELRKFNFKLNILNLVLTIRQKIVTIAFFTFKYYSYLMLKSPQKAAAAWNFDVNFLVLRNNSWNKKWLKIDDWW